MLAPPETAAAEDVLRWAATVFPNRFAISTSFQQEGMVLIDMASRLGEPFRVITLDTGRLPQETYDMMDTVRTRYGVPVEMVFPDRDAVERMAALHGVNLFYRDVPHRNLCCHLRKVMPLERKLREFDAWATGLRREQSGARADAPKVDAGATPVKLNPLADWTRAQVEEYTRRFDVPRHPLYERGYTSIGCAPCTRAVAPGEAERAGRWWWEQDRTAECGIHFSPQGEPRRTLDVLIEQILRK